MMVLTASGPLDSFVQFITVLFIFLFVLIVTYAVTKWISGIQKIQMTGKNMTVLETLRISNSKYLQIVRAGDKYLVIAVCKDTVTMLTELSAGSLCLDTGNEEKSLSFREILDKMKNQNVKEEKTDEEKNIL